MRSVNHSGLSKRLLSFSFLACLIVVVSLLVPAGLAGDPTIYGTLPEKFSSPDDGFIVIQSNAPVGITMFGTYVNQVTHISFSTVQYANNGSCEHHRATVSFPVTSKSPFVGVTIVTLRELSSKESAFFLCIRVPRTPVGPKAGVVSSQGGADDDTRAVWLFATPEENSTASADIPVTGLAYRTTSSLMPLWVQVIIIIILFCLSGLFSGLNLGLMSLDKTELKIIESAGAPNEKLYAKAIRPIRAKGNLLLCTLLLGNVLVNTSLTILMDDITGSGLFAVIASTIGITVFGEIVPQAVCSRHGLAIGAKTLWLTKVFMLILFPLAYPISFILDKALGEELGQVYSREKLCVLINEQAVAGTVAADERKIITGALALTTKTVVNVMTPLAEAFMLSFNDVLDFNTMEKIYSNGYTRIPIYEGDRENIRSILNIKDLAFVNAEHRVPVSTIVGMYNAVIILVEESTHLDAMLKEFLQSRTHMAFVEKVVTRGEGDPQREIMGLVTLEDVIEEIIQAEIVDETDILDESGKRRNHFKRDFRMFRMHDGTRPPRLAPQLKIAALRHLSSNFPAFSENMVSNSLLQSFLNSDIVFEHTFNTEDDEANILYRINVPSKVAILLLQGRVSVAVGEERLVFEAESFYMFGQSLLTRTNEVIATLPPSSGEPRVSTSLADEISFTPDYTLTAKTNLLYLRITPSNYMLLRLMHEHRARSRSMNRCESETSDWFHSLTSLPTIFPTVDSQNVFQYAWDHRMSDHLQERTSVHSLTPDGLGSNDDWDVERQRQEQEQQTITARQNRRPSSLTLQSGDVRSSRPEELNSLLTSIPPKGSCAASDAVVSATGGSSLSKPLPPPPDQPC